MTATTLELESPILSPYASAEFNASFWHELKYLASDVALTMGRDLIAVVLGGGFGRSEGCITLSDGHEVPFNDVDLFLITRTANPRSMAKIKRLAERYEHRLKIAVDFSRPQTLPMIAKWPPLLMWQELVKGHLVLYGPEDILTRYANPRLRNELPLVEASRLLLNRGAGLLWAARVNLGLENTPDESFVVRNYFKCAQALADATLIAFGRYCSDPAEKADRLKLLASVQPVVDDLCILKHLQASTEFRQAPYAHRIVSTNQLRTMAQQWCHLFLWLENKRLDRNFAGISEYVEWRGTRESASGHHLRLIASNLRLGRIGWHHPRQRVYRSLASSLSELANSIPHFEESSFPALKQWREAQ
jgi:hypothetical protein